ASKLLAAMWNDGRIEPLVERGTEWLAAWLAEQRQAIAEKVRTHSWRWLPRWVDRAIADKITAGLLQLLLDVRDPDHPWRRGVAVTIEALILRLAEDPDYRRRGEELKQRMLADPRLGDHIHRLWSDMRRQLETDWSHRSEDLEVRIERLFADLGGWLRRDPAVQRTLNTSARVFVRGVLAPRRQEIGRFVAQVVDGWDTRGVVDRLELQVGPDLQYIRVNGTLVGGLVGLALFTLSRLLGWV
ncbi:MAG: DUF445 domain-containing protein, partial [Pseudomonadota bacterium]|nr:DUF445 domain-containing protein [Pseudomonadota bacterium]